jgi:hypothetical protein
MSDKDDRVLDALERWKKRLISAFALLSLIIAILVALIIEVAALVDTVGTVHAGHQSVPSRPAPADVSLRHQ